MAGLLWRSSPELLTVGRFEGDVCPACGELFRILSGRSVQRVRTDSRGARRFVVVDAEGWLAHMCELTDSGLAKEALVRLRGAESLHDIHQAVRTAARQLVDADGATFVLRSDDECIYVDEDAISPLWRGQRFPVSECISGWAMLHNEHAAIRDITRDERIPQDAYRPTFVKSLLMTPIGHGNETFGAIGAYWAQSYRATDRDIEALRELADATADALNTIELT